MIPLICDPVPGPPTIITTSRRLSADERERLLRLWNAASRGGPIRQMLIKDKRVRFEPLVGERTEWPDAEYCGA
jgi:hypothetical protein